jgi:hypothetical protein
MEDWQSLLAFRRNATAKAKCRSLRMLTGDEVFNILSQGYLGPVEADRTWIEHEFDVFEYYRPSDEELARVARPVKVLFGADSPPFFGEAAHWLAVAWAPRP